MLVLVLLLVSVFGSGKVYARDLKQSEYNAIIHILKVFEIEPQKIIAISEILKTKNTPCNNGELYNRDNGKPCKETITPIAPPITKSITPITQSKVNTKPTPLNIPSGFATP